MVDGVAVADIARRGIEVAFVPHDIDELDDEV
jgi:hypothetical protein